MCTHVLRSNLPPPPRSLPSLQHLQVSFWCAQYVLQQKRKRKERGRPDLSLSLSLSLSACCCCCCLPSLPIGLHRYPFGSRFREYRRMKNSPAVHCWDRTYNDQSAGSEREREIKCNLSWWLHVDTLKAHHVTFNSKRERKLFLQRFVRTTTNLLQSNHVKHRKVLTLTLRKQMTFMKCKLITN